MRILTGGPLRPLPSLLVRPFLKSLLRCPLSSQCSQRCQNRPQRLSPVAFSKSHQMLLHDQQSPCKRCAQTVLWPVAPPCGVPRHSHLTDISLYLLQNPALTIVLVRTAPPCTRAAVSPCAGATVPLKKRSKTISRRLAPSCPASAFVRATMPGPRC